MSPLVLRTAPIISSLVQCISWRKNGEAGAQDVPGRNILVTLVFNHASNFGRSTCTDFTIDLLRVWVICVTCAHHV